ncbi:MAG: sensor histidine kinase [Salibacteraceae bacterium]
MKNSSFLRIDLLFHLIAIPAFLVLSVLFLKGGQQAENSNFNPIWHLVESLIWIVFIWQCNRLCINLIRQKLMGAAFLWRILLQLMVSIGIGFITVFNSAAFHSFLVEPEKGLWECLIWSQRVTLPILVYSIFEMATYESFLLFKGLSESQLETEKYRKESVEARFQNLKNQLNPHFLFNSFNTLATIIEENPKVAVDFVQELSSTYRYVLSSQKRDWVQLSEELEMIRSFLFLLKKRHEKGLEVSIEVAPEMTKRWLPPLSVQMLVENALKHNEASDDRPLHIQLKAKGDVLIVENNRNPRKVVNGEGIGLSNIRSRYRFLSDREVVLHDEAKRFAVELPLMEMVES